MRLPGGLWRDGAVRRDFAFRPPTGALELALAEAGRAPHVPAAVTTVLASALERVGGEAASPELARELAVGDRQFLVRQLAAWLGRDGEWLTADCGGCGASFDLYVEQSALPVKEAGDGYPFAAVKTRRGRRRLRVPCGGDQEAVAGLDEPEAAAELVRRCLAAASAAAPRALGVDETAALDAALEAVAPEVGLAVLAHCPDCGAAQEVPVDPYLCLARAGRDLFTDIHALATTYHWSEAEILALPTDRRRLYLELIDRARGMTT